ncbi:hypothetical protein BHF71_00120 [Vulcanibacillus modesticaldus]|uniref:endopeptidase La n=1 Tax=Vulcanibacillus modesticaldus TaxID=337097 RepID=A0A1D2YX69_9BACI|nr:SepM family pheromone-processing serine protease [Vulcanibacillus modesticaldus]OEG00351.1 hypothetical protein BHF71_00120 [Vulcanibacillus modesticaldus]
MVNPRKLNLNKSKVKRSQRFFIGIIILIFISFYIPVPYYVSMPGSAIELNSLVEVKGGYQESGNFMLTTVKVMPGTLSSFIYSQFSKNAELIPKEYIMSDDEDPEDYTKRQLKVMSESQQNSIIAAFNYLKLPIEVTDKGIVVMGLLSGVPSEKILKVGDLIIEVDDREIKRTDDLLSYFKEKEEGEIINVTYIRDEEIRTSKIPLVNLVDDDQNNFSKKVGLGIYPSEEKEVITSKNIVFKTEDIGGPSAGLMFTLEIINQLIPNDLTKGYQIAGTGTITPNGIVGQIGGARLKVKAAYEKGAEIFFVPKDTEVNDTNQRDAENSNKDLGSPMKIISVSTISDAINYLEQLPVKETPVAISNK